MKGEGGVQVGGGDEGVAGGVVCKGREVCKGAGLIDDWLGLGGGACR